ncbi:MAG: DUF368 domain-containing protein [Butyricicoccaceae bacterium]
MNIICGFFMALADSVPGVSGGTIAFLMGFYDQFIGSLDALISGTKQQKKDALRFLIRLGAGWIVGMVLAVLILTQLFQQHIYQVSSVFLGFILFSIPLICKEEAAALKGRYRNLIFTLIGILIVVAITILNPSGGGTEATVSSLFGYLYVFVAGMIAISAMVLPGISGSTLLLIFGLYVPIMNGIRELLSLNFQPFPMVLAFGLGIIAGVILVIRGVRSALEHFRPQTIYTILGLMIGSLYAIVRGPETLDVPMPAMTPATFSILCFVLGGIIVCGLQLLKKLKK